MATLSDQQFAVQTFTASTPPGIDGMIAGEEFQGNFGHIRRAGLLMSPLIGHLSRQGGVPFLTRIIPGNIAGQMTFILDFITLFSHHIVSDTFTTVGLTPLRMRVNTAIHTTPFRIRLRDCQQMKKATETEACHHQPFTEGTPSCPIVFLIHAILNSQTIDVLKRLQSASHHPRIPNHPLLECLALNV